MTDPPPCRPGRPPRGSPAAPTTARGRPRRACALLLASSLALAAAPALAAPAEDHFHVGLQLFQAGNYTGAQAEFEEAYRLRPTPSSLQNVALCQRALFRYAESIATLERMLREHADAVDPEDAKAAREAIVEMSRLVAQVRLRIEPPDALVTIDDRPVEGGAERVIRLNVGEHRVVASAPRHVRSEQSLSFAGGERELTIRLTAIVGTVAIEAAESTAAIEVDGVFRAFGSWTGELAADQAHVVRVLEDGRAITTTEVTLGRGERREVRIARGARDDRVRSPYSTAAPPAAVANRSGPYGFLTATSYTMLSHPDGFRPEPDANGASTFFGLRAGYRFTTLFGLEGHIDTGSHSVGPGCYNLADTPAECSKGTDPNQPSYDLTTRRVGASARFMTNGDRFRFLASGGVGLAYHRLTLKTVNVDGPDDKILSGSTYQAFVLLEAGVELSFGRALVGGVLSIAFDGANNLHIGDGQDEQRAFSGQRNIGMAGVGLRLGYGHWLTSRSPRPEREEAPA